MSLKGDANLKPAIQTSVGASAVQLIGTNAQRQALIITNEGSGNVRIGDSTVTTTTGTRLVPNAIMTLTDRDAPRNSIWAISETGTNTVTAQEES